MVLTEIWDTTEHQARFVEERLGAALVEGGDTSAPSSVTWIELVAHNTPGG
jgi:hypothetical protein